MEKHNDIESYCEDWRKMNFNKKTIQSIKDRSKIISSSKAARAVGTLGLRISKEVTTDKFGLGHSPVANLADLESVEMKQLLVASATRLDQRML